MPTKQGARVVSTARPEAEQLCFYLRHHETPALFNMKTPRPHSATPRAIMKHPFFFNMKPPHVIMKPLVHCTTLFFNATPPPNVKPLLPFNVNPQHLHETPTILQDERNPHAPS